MRDGAETLVDVRPLPQSSGSVLPGGDCGYCCIAGLFGAPTIQAAYEFREAATAGHPSWKNRQAMCTNRWRYLLEGVGLPFAELLPSFDHYKLGLAELPWHNHNWKVALQRVIKAGQAVVASIRFNRSPPAPPVDYENPQPGQGHDSDHNVLITGYRERLVPHKTLAGCGTWLSELRVSCSVRGDWWMDWSLLLYWHGLAGCIPVDPAAARAAYQAFLASPGRFPDPPACDPA